MGASQRAGRRPQRGTEDIIGEIDRKAIRGRAARPRSPRVSLVEDETLTRSLLENLIAGDAGLELVHSASGVQEAMLLLHPGASDVAVVDVHLDDGNGVSLALSLQRRDPSLAIVLLSAHDVMGLFTAAQSEASRPWSYLSKRSAFSRGVLLRAIAAAADGQVVIDPVLLARSRPRTGTAVAELTSSQLQVLRLVAEGLSNRAIATRLVISERSVESHLLAIYRRLGLTGESVNRRVSAALMFIEQTGRMPLR